jgi:hypothetical protein
LREALPESETEPNHGTTAKPYKRQGFREGFHILEILVGSLTATLGRRETHAVKAEAWLMPFAAQ